MNGNELSATLTVDRAGEAQATRSVSPDRWQSPSQQDSLGEPLAIEEVARLLGCSAWTVRQRYVRQGLPYLQARPRGKLVFFRAQVVAWIEKRQRHTKGGLLR